MCIKGKKGLTLIELLVVLGIIGLLAIIAIPQYVNLLEKANLAATIGNLSAIRSALSIYNATYLEFPRSIDPNDEPKFKENLPEVPYVKSKYPGGSESPYGNTVTVSIIFNETPSTKGHGWFYNSIDGKVYINSIATDIKGNIYSSY
ncbi:MAG: type II secretion system GspH family protein [Candidatus Goldbacteria bacterium]|nr:type II secretion system GspH family protein [Candidatus Goldiibacteriota bacterium]